MKITVYGMQGKKGVTYDYGLATCTACELEKTLAAHCEAAGVDPADAVIAISGKEAAGCKPGDDEYVVKGASPLLSLKAAAAAILKICGMGYGECGGRPAGAKPFANGFGYFCAECGIFFSVQMEPGVIGGVNACPCCGGDAIIRSAEALLDYCICNLTDPVNFYSAFPPGEPIPDSRTGATPRQVEWIVGCAASDKQKKLPVSIGSLADQLGCNKEIVAAVFEELHITETGRKE